MVEGQRARHKTCIVNYILSEDNCLFTFLPFVRRSRASGIQKPSLPCLFVGCVARVPRTKFARFLGGHDCERRVRERHPNRRVARTYLEMGPFDSEVRAEVAVNACEFQDRDTRPFTRPARPACSRTARKASGSPP